MDIKCFSDTTKYISALDIVSNGTVKAIGNNKTVSYSFIPDRTDHLTKYQCVDRKHSSIRVEVELSIMCKYVGKYKRYTLRNLTTTLNMVYCDKCIRIIVVLFSQMVFTKKKKTITSCRIYIQ